MPSNVSDFDFFFNLNFSCLPELGLEDRQHQPCHKQHRSSGDLHQRELERCLQPGMGGR